MSGPGCACRADSVAFFALGEADVGELLARAVGAGGSGTIGVRKRLWLQVQRLQAGARCCRCCGLILQPISLAVGGMHAACQSSSPE
jgi:hypothetical protein